MCGICGIYHHGKIEVSPTQIRHMRDCMIERGPDSAGYEILPEIALGHRRLKIIDLSDAASQPMANEDRSVWVVFNGEIYNYRELRKILVEAGHHFRSDSDTEVLVHGYEEWGTELFRKIAGMFAIAIFDSNRKCLILARDRVGKKPLYFAEMDGAIYFASDIKAVFFNLPRSPETDPAAVDCYFHHISVPDQHTIFRGIHKVQPGTYECFSKDKRNREVYWDITDFTKSSDDEASILNNAEQILTASALRRTISDVPLGLMLSGGVDSGVLAALLARNMSQRLKTFTVAFKGQENLDAQFAREVAEFFQTEHTELTLDTDATEILPELVWQYGEPFADSSAIPTYLICQAAKPYITVLLTGDGGDESFGGYASSIAPFNAGIFKRRVPAFLHPALTALFKACGVNPESNSLPGRMLYYMNYISGFPYHSFYNKMGFHHYRNELWNPDFLTNLGEHDPMHAFHEFFDRVKDQTDLDQVFYADLKTRLPFDYLVKVDRASAANSVEVRSPFLDHELIEFMARVPSEIKFRDRQTKYLLKKIGEKYLPKNLLYAEKRGFDAPTRRWLSGDAASTIELIIFSRSAQNRGYFNFEFIRQIWNEHQRGIYDHRHRLWALLWFELWNRMFIDKTLTRDMPLSEAAKLV